MLDAMLPYQVNYYGNPHSRTHAYGWESETAMETARKVERHAVCTERERKQFSKVKLNISLFSLQCSSNVCMPLDVHFLLSKF